MLTRRVFILTGSPLFLINDDFWQNQQIKKCCSEADALYADEWISIEKGGVRATVTGSGPLGHLWAPIGKNFDVDADKVITNTGGNPTGHALLFLNKTSFFVYCFVPGAGI